MGEMTRAAVRRTSLATQTRRGPDAAMRGAHDARGRESREGREGHDMRESLRLVGGHALQPSLMLGAANDPFEQEAEQTAEAVTSTGAPRAIASGGIAARLMRFVRRALGKGEPPTHKDDDDKPKRLQKEAANAGAAAGPVPAGVEVSIDAMSAAGGAPLPPGLRAVFEPRFGFDFADVRVHTGAEAAVASRKLGARAFTVGDHVFFGAGEFQPASREGQKLIAHELTHTIQQKPAAARAARTATATAPVHAAPKRVQRAEDGGSTVRDKVRDFVTQDFPPWDLITLIIGWDPLRDREVKGSTRDWIRAAMKLAPDGEALFGRLDGEGKIEAIAKWWDSEVAKLDLTLDKVKALLAQAWDAVSIGDVLSPRAAWNEKVKPILQPTITRVWDFIKAVGAKVYEIVKSIVLDSISAWAQQQKGYTLLTFVLGRDPVSGEPVKRTAKGLIYAVLDLVDGGEQIKENLEKSRTIEKASAWFSEQVKKLDLTWDGIKALFSKAWDAFKVADLLDPKALFQKMAEIFGPPLGRLLDFLIAVGKKVLELIFEGAMLIAGPIGQQIAGIFRKIGETFNLIVADPVAFVGHLVDAVKKGIDQFGKNIWEHLKTGLIEWLVGALDGAGLVLPKVWDLHGILDLVLQILGITYAKMRVKLVKVLGEKTVSMLEKAFAFIKTLVTEGPAAAWMEIVQAIGSLWDMVIDGIKDWAVTKIVTAAVTKLATMFNPAGAIIQAIIATYNTVAFFIERIKQIVAFVDSVVDSISNIAHGKIAQAANYVERAMARTIPVILGFLARLIGLGDVSAAIQKVIKKIQDKVDKGIDTVINWVVGKAKSMFGKGEEKKGDPKAPGGDVGELPKATFPEDDETHTVSMRKEGSKWQVVISSTPTDFKAFIAAAKKNESLPDDAKATQIPLAEAAVNKMIALEKELETASPDEKENKRKALADAEVELANALRKLLAGTNVKKFDERYKLEGMVATYGSMPRQVEDKLTPDHQPQASLLQYAAKATDKTGALLFQGTRLLNVVTGHATEAVAINLHHERHKLGATYGRSPPPQTLKDIDAAAKSGMERDDKRKAILELVDAQLDVDVKAMRAVANATSNNYKDIEIWAGSPKKALPLIEKVQKQIVGGEDKMRSQNLQSLKN
jgi:hypothetical protein